MRKLLLLISLSLLINHINLKAQKAEALAIDSSSIVGLWDSVIFWFAEDIDICNAFLDRGLIQYKSAGNYPKYLDCLLGKINVFFQKSEYDLALQYSIRAEKEAIELLGKSSREYGNALFAKASMFEQIGNYTEATKIYQHIINLKLEGSELDLPTNLQALGRVSRLRGDYQGSLSYLNKVSRLNSKNAGTNNIDFLPIANMLDIARVHNSIQQPDTAIWILNKLKENLRVRTSNKKGARIKYNFSINNTLANAHLIKGNIDQCIFFADANINLPNSSEHKNISASYRLKGNAYFKKGNFKEALYFHKKALSSNLDNYTEYSKHPDLSENYRQIAKVQFSRDSFDLALDQIQLGIFHATDTFKANDINVLPPASDILQRRSFLELLYDKAAILLAKQQSGKGTIKDLEIAVSTCTVAHDFLRMLYQQFEAEGSKLSLYQNALAIYELGIESSQLLYEHSNNNDYLIKAWQFAEYSKAAMMREAFNEDIAMGLGQVPDSLLSKEKNLNLLISLNNHRISDISNSTSPSNKKLDQIREQLFDLKQQLRDLKDHIKIHYPKYYEYKYDKSTIDIQSLSNHLQKQQALLIEYFLGKRKVFVFCMSENGIQLHSFSTSEFNPEKISLLRSLITKDPTSDLFDKEAKQYYETAYQLYTQLVQPAIVEHNTKANRLIIIPDGAINYIPFGLLISEKTKTPEAGFALNNFQYLLEDYTISYAYSATHFVKNELNKPSRKGNTFIGFAPSFEGGTSRTRSDCISDQPLSQLHCNQKEITQIGDITKGSYYVSDKAIKSVFMAEASNHQIIHLATHACVDPLNPHLNKIYFTDDDLSHFDLQHLDLNAELVVLSACNSGIGKLQAGEGLMSLSRSFHLAGCKSSLMSLWPVDDCITSEIMYSFYEYLQKGLTKDQALKNAKLDYLNNTDLIGAHPYYWAAFVLFGSQQAIDIPSGSLLSIGNMGIIVCLSIFIFFMAKKRLISLLHFYKK